MGVQIPNYKDIINDAMERNDAFSSQTETCETEESGDEIEENNGDN